jgi:hypothetical protein
VINLTGEQVPPDHAALNTISAKLAATPMTQRSASSGSAAVAGSAVPLPAGVELRAGETLQVNYSDGIVVHQAVTAACSVTSSVTKPDAAPLWHQRDFETTTVFPNTTWYCGTVKGCVNSGSTTWHAENAVGSSTISLSPNVHLACNPG